MKKRVLSLALAALMAIGLLAGCGGPDGSDETGKAGGETGGETGEAGDGGKVLNIYVQNYFQEPWKPKSIIELYLWLCELYPILLL